MQQVFAYSLCISKGTMIDPRPTLGIWPWHVFVLMMMVLLHTPGAVDHAIVACQVALHKHVHLILLL